MKKRWLLVVFCICVLSLLISCSKSLPQSSDNANSVFTDELMVSNSSDEKQNENIMNENEEKEMEKIFKSLVDKNYDCITQLFYYGHLSYKADSIDDVNHTAVVNSDRFVSLNDIKQYLSSIYVEKEVDRLLNDYFESKPLYYEEDGKLCIFLDQASNAGLPIPWKKYEIDTIDLNGDSCFFSVKVEYEVDELYVGEPIEIYEFKAINEDGWKLTEVVYKPR